MVYWVVQSTAQGFTKPKQPHLKKSARFCVNPRLPRKEENTFYYISCLLWTNIHPNHKYSLRLYNIQRPLKILQESRRESDHSLAYRTLQFHFWAWIPMMRFSDSCPATEFPPESPTHWNHGCHQEVSFFPFPWHGFRF